MLNVRENYKDTKQWHLFYIDVMELKDLEPHA